MSNRTAGREYWQSIQQLAESPELDAKIAQEFPGYDPKEIASLSRRSFMRLMGASMALAGVTLTGCRRWPKETIVPYSSNVKERIPGVPEQYATLWELDGIATGLLATSFDGRPIKVEGSPIHPFSKVSTGKTGVTDLFAQASVLELYDPERSKSPVDRSTPESRNITLEQFLTAVSAYVSQIKSTSGAGVAVLAAPSSSLSLAAARTKFLAAYPQAAWYEYAPLNRDSEITGTKAAFGTPARPVLALDKADVVVSFDADLLGTHPAHLRYANDWAQSRKRADTADSHGHRTMNRLFIVESTFSITGTVADARLGAKSSRIPLLVGLLAKELGVSGITTSGEATEAEAKFIKAAAADLKAAGAKAVVAVGANLPSDAHAAAVAINAHLASTAVAYFTDELADRPTHAADIAKLSTDMAAGSVKLLIILGGNPAYDAPADTQFAKALRDVPASIHLSLYDNETSAACKWHLNSAHYLETWADGRAYDGTITVGQPLIEPLYNGFSPAQLLTLLTTGQVVDGRTLQSETLATYLPPAKDAAALEVALRAVRHDGLLAGTAFPVVAAKPKALGLTLAAAESTGIELRFIADQKLHDGRFANSGWLQETPTTASKITWDNALLISKTDADALGVWNDDLVNITANGVTVQLPVYIQPGQPRGSAAVALGYGRTRAGWIGNNVGTDVYPLRTAANFHTAPVTIAKAAGRFNLACTVDHHILDVTGMYGKEKRLGKFGENGYIIREGTLEDYNKSTAFAYRGRHIIVPLQLFDPPHQFNDPHAWGMSVDMSACIGCNACAVACQAENNIPVVGKREVERNREMAWLRIDRYFKAPKTTDDKGNKVEDLDNVEVVYQPMMCVHCENAPCEQVCPVAATVHDTEGLNTMVYNRCIGTRYCSNNCPYKVRRFNYFDWHSRDPRAIKDHTLNHFHPYLGIPDQQQADSIDKIKAMVFNPEVTVRMRGVMEKCTYCVQRIHNVKIAKKAAGQQLVDGDIVTACQQVCPTEAITFGDLNNPDSAVAIQHRSPRAYAPLDELNTRPRTRYLAKVRNPHPDLRKVEAKSHEAHSPADSHTAPATH
jgi:molybdopterin-containing oxidoreductase family iron-sulfur binding subunit